MLRLVKDIVYGIRYLLKTYAPLAVIRVFVSDKIFARESTSHYKAIQSDFRKSLSTYSFSSDWFTEKIPFWLLTFDDYNLHAKAEIDALEIGSWEGCSSLFLLKTLPNARLTCVDLWEGSRELKDAGANETGESNFDANISAFKDRLTKFKGTSFSYFISNPAHNKFDFIYVDGSHYTDDVVMDAFKSFEQLKVGGVMIFDDYFWRYYPRTIENPAAAINMFLRLKSGKYKVVHVYEQLIIEKTGDSH